MNFVHSFKLFLQFKVGLSFQRLGSLCMGSLFWVVFLEDLYGILISDFYVAFGGSSHFPLFRLQLMMPMNS